MVQISQGNIGRGLQKKAIFLRLNCYLQLQTLTTSSTPPVATNGLCKQKSNAETKWEWASLMVLIARPCFRSHTRRLLSSDTLIKYFPLGCHFTPLTQLSWPIWKKKVNIHKVIGTRVTMHNPVATSHTFIVLSLDPEAINVPDDLPL